MKRVKRCVQSTAWRNLLRANKPVTAISIVASGIVSALGQGVAANVAALYQGTIPVRQKILAEFNPAFSVPYCQVDGGPALIAERLGWLLDQTYSQIKTSCTLSVAQLAQLPLFIGSSSYGIGIGEERYRQQYQMNPAQALPLPLDGFTQISQHLCRAHGLRGADYAFNTACTATSNALLAAMAALNAKQCDYALVVGLETYNATTLGGFHSMQLVAERGMRPFDKRRNGLVLGEGCGMLLLARASEHHAELQLCGGASQCDTYSISSCNPDGSSVVSTMQVALDVAGITASEVQAIKAHGTATPLNDDSEAAGMRLLFDAAQVPPFFCLKAALGHTLGSCGVMETLLTAACLQAGKLPASAGFEQVDPALAIAPLARPMTAQAGYYLLNFFGFGGNNSSLLLRYQPS